MDDNPFQRFKAEWLYRRDIHRQKKRAAKIAREQIEEIERQHRLQEGAPSIGDRIVEIKDTKTSRLGVRVLVLLGFFLLLASGYLLWQKQMHIRRLYQKLAGDRQVMVSVNGNEIRRGQLESRMRERHGRRDLLLESLMTLLREASRNISVHSRSYRTLEDAERDTLILDLAQEADFLEEKILLSKVTEEEKKALFEERQEELAIYELSSLRFKSVEQAEAFVEAYMKGKTPERAAEEHSMDTGPVRMEPIMSGDLETELGVFHAKAIRALERGRFSTPLPTKEGHFVIYQIIHLDSEFDQVLPAINSQFACRGREELRRTLVENANIVSSEITPEDLIKLKL